ncbi:hypothetical protein FN846DRAFT_894840 [Sphaerosporella brunnea]|uniref:Uncharacterized protein n=1 Tax=Sphaerosporella brunnea TaxID=1250544 RepID=A0A5J5EHK5_9PEZI|nr:hypothetical protein FN846DRAFT_894840 [Sphaerosporella brunnea]
MVHLCSTHEPLAVPNIHPLHHPVQAATTDQDSRDALHAVPGHALVQVDQQLAPLLFTLPSELHLSITSYLPEDDFAMPIALATGLMSRHFVLPCYLPATDNAKQRLLSEAYIIGLPRRIVLLMLDIIGITPPVFYAAAGREYIYIEDDYDFYDVVTRYERVCPYPDNWHAHKQGNMVGLLNIAAAKGDIRFLESVLTVIVASIGSSTSWERWETVVFAHYPTPVHYSAMYAQHEAMEWLLEWYRNHVPLSLEKVMGGICTHPDSGKALSPTPFQQALQGYLHPGRTEEHVLRTLQLLEQYPVVEMQRESRRGGLIADIASTDELLPVSMMKVVMRRIEWPPDDIDVYDPIEPLLEIRDVTVEHLELLFNRGYEPDNFHTLYFWPLRFGNACIVNWMLDKMSHLPPEKRPTVGCLWTELYHTLQFSLTPRPWPNYKPLYEVLISASRRLEPIGFSGQTLCRVILAGAWLTGWYRYDTPFHDPDFTPRRWFLEMADALIRAGANVHEPWRDDPSDRRYGDQPRIREYLGWTASQMWEKLNREGGL